ncbi:MAG: hypothetical protein ACREMS_04775 [Gemmatimonadaceae bacterium]
MSTRVPRLLLGTALLSAACSDHSTREARASETAGTPVMATADNSVCDASLWQHLYQPKRLKILDACKVVTGVVQDVQPDDDGDMHAVLMLDQGQESLVNKRNTKKKGSGLVIEIVCSLQPKSPKSAIKACAGYHASVTMPKAGTHARVTGSYVLDTHNGWEEIHPVSRIDVLR